MARSRNARHKDKMRKRQQRLQVVERFTYYPVDSLWKNEKVAELETTFTTYDSAENSQSLTSIPLTNPVAFRKIIGDGNCFFRCLSYIITGDERNHRSIRKLICAYMESHSDMVKSYLPAAKEKSVYNYLKTTNMKQDSIWATEVEIFVASMLLRTNIYIYTKHGVHWTWTRHTTQFTDTNKAIYLFHKNLNHYEVVVGVDNSEVPRSISNDSQYYILNQDCRSSFNKRLKECEGNQKRNLAYRNKYKSDQTYRDNEKNRKSSKYKTDSVLRKNQKTRQQNKYKTDVEFQKKKQMSSRLRQKHKYMTNPVYSQAKRTACRQYYIRMKHYRAQMKFSFMGKYSTNHMFRNRLLLLSRQRYLQNKFLKEKLKKLSRKKYSENSLHRQNVKLTSRKKYADNSIHKERVKLISRKKYAENSCHRENVKCFSRKKYAENSCHREKVKRFSRKKYAENAIHKQKVQQYSKMKYHRFDSFRHHVRASSVKKYASSPLFRSCIKKHLRDQYHSSTSVRESKKTRVYVCRKSVMKAIQKFKKNVTDAPKYICTVCIRILYRSQVKICNRDNYSSDGQLNKTAEECLTGLYIHDCHSSCKDDCMMKNSDRDKEWICHNCHRYLKNENMPPQSMNNNLLLPEIPEVLAKLNVLERQLIALRIPFMKLLSLPRGGQKGVKGPIVSVPTDLNTVCTSLPRNFNDSQLIKVKLKRKLEYKGHYTYKWINPSNVLEALQDLLDNNCWYDNINLNKSWIENINDSELTEPTMEVDDSDSEDETSQPTEPSYNMPVDSCFQPIDIGQEMLDSSNTLCLAPAEHQKPQNIFQEDGADAMAFPVLLPNGRYGLFENRKIKLSPAKYFNARLFSADTRFSTDKEFIFFSQYVTEINYISSNISLALRKGKTTTNDGKKVTASMILDSENSNEILKTDIGYRFLQPIRGTPPYWQRTMKDLYAMIRQLGIPTWFVTFSAAEMRWEEVTKTLLYINNDSRQVADVEWSERATLVSDNPVMCARMFDHRVKALFTDLLMSHSCPVGKVIDYFYRTEFQQRGSPHIHCLLWIKDAPKFNENTDKEVCQFIDKYVTCRMPDETLDPELFEIISSVQLHSKNHSKSCKKYTSACRFNFPRPPVNHTFIARADSDKKDPEMSSLKKPTVEELDQMSRQSAKTSKQILRDLWILLSTADETHLTFSEILQLTDVTYTQFEQCLKDIATRNTVHIRRELSDIWVNNYNPHLSRAWNANLDIQFVTDAYACVAYILSYISKAETEMGDLLKNAKEEADEGNMDAAAAMRKIANVYLQNREVSSQEAVYRVCGLHLKQCTRDVVFIPAGHNIQKMSLPISIIKARSSHGGNEEDI